MKEQLIRAAKRITPTPADAARACQVRQEMSAYCKARGFLAHEIAAGVLAWASDLVEEK